MARRYGPGYQKYRGRRGGGSAALKIIIVLLALVLAAGVLFVLFMGKYVEYTDNGVRLNLPWGKEASEPPEVSVPVVIVTEEPTPTPEPSSAVLADIGAVEVGVSQLLDGTAAQSVTDAGGSALVLEMKAASGALAWQSGTELAETLGVNGNEMVAQAVRTLSETGELYLVARINCFRDTALVKSTAVDATLMTRGGNIWYDSNGGCWVSPVSGAVTDYLTALCLELADMGFDEILLDSAGYPDFGEVEVLATDDKRPEDLTAPVTAFYEKLSAALEDSGVVLSVQASGQMMGQAADGGNSGVSAAALAQYVSRVWLPEEPGTEQYAALLEAAGLADPERRLVLENGTKESGSWYVTG